MNNRTKVFICLLSTLATSTFAQNIEHRDSIARSHDLDEVIVTSSARRINSAEIGVENVQIKEMSKIPSLLGERDIIKSLQLLPGVKAESDGSTGFQVRGGRSGQNHILLDDATIYNAGHLMGVFSTFNDAILASVSLYKGTPPAQFGGGSSSVLNVVTKNGNQDFSLSGTVGLLSAKICADIPIGKKVTAFVAARRTYFDLFLKMIEKYRGTTMNFYDVNGKICYNINNTNRLLVSFFRGRDNMGMDDMLDSGWNNTSGNIRYWHEFNDHHNMSTSVFLSSYLFESATDFAEVTSDYDTTIKHAGLKQTFTWSPTEGFTLNYGFQTKYNSLKSLNIYFQNMRRTEQRYAWENDIWANADWKITDRLTVLAGLRLNAFSVLGGSPYYDLDPEGKIIKTHEYSGGEIVKTHFTAEPRFSANYRITNSSSIKVGYAIASQNIRPIYNNGMSSIFNRYTMSSNIIKPEIAQQTSLGFTKLINNGEYEITAEGYYKSLDNVLDYKDGKNFGSEIEVERIVLSGKGRSYGFELLGRKNVGRLTGWIGYTLCWTENKIDGINNGNWYTASNDRRHDISVVAMYDLTKKWQLSASWIYLSGQAFTVPSAKYEINGETIYYYSERNGYRAPAYHRLDVSAIYKRNHLTKKGRHWSDEWVFSVYNLYNRYNPFTISFKTNSIYPTGTKATLTALFGMLPSISYNFYF